MSEADWQCGDCATLFEGTDTRKCPNCGGINFYPLADEVPGDAEGDVETDLDLDRALDRRRTRWRSSDEVGFRSSADRLRED